MKAFLNPLLLLVCILLLAFSYVSSSSEGGASTMVETWVLTLCLLAVIINGTLGTARAMTGLPSVQLIGWAVGFLVFGCVVWTLVSAEGMESISSQERALLHQRMEAWKKGRLDPFRPDEHGESMVVLAAGLGKTELLRKVVTPGAASLHAEEVARAAHRAAERNRPEVLDVLMEDAHLPVGVRVECMTPLHTAALSKARRSAARLLELGASANETDADGATPLHHAVLAEDVRMVRLLMQHGANPAAEDDDGRTAASYARSEAVQAALCPQPAAP